MAIHSAISCAKCLLEWIVRGYLWTLGICLVIFIILAIAANLGNRRSKYRFLAKFIMIYFATIMGTTLLIPVFLFRPRNVINCKIVGWFIRKCSYLLEITWEVRGARLLQDNVGGLICANHQSSIDILAMFNLWELMDRVTGIAKKEMFYVFPFGPAAWLAGLPYIDRQSPKSGYQTLGRCAKLMKEEDIKMFIYPEGTRNSKRGLLPFKRGAFKTAITAKVPITPLVVSPYYFIDAKKYIFDKGHVIISVLDPIDTADLKDTDTDTLMTNCRNLMLEEYEKLAREVDSKSTDAAWRDRNRPRIVFKDE
ncbi:1-acyl-sn-glycerol-3-phosphate acyltransferase beta-like [Lutzomyia longipalpis]|uniref:1-acylglycerol-3-phosphate O-acyltransferase n=2 Tax=Lutzomyia longipalpis TaxID=7200 RepID=A0A7G3A9P0_LUTLO|nr:1-acyl-sn-glycerol-3-phosphate acyltransferase beta-like [Lutzomyia longipalpis]